MFSTETMIDIANHDPDGRPHTDAEYAEFRRWVGATYGYTAWRAYLTTWA